MFYNIENSNKGYFVHYVVRSAMKMAADISQRAYVFPG